MKTQLLLAGVACVVAAVVGGGLKLLGAEIPLISSTRRQALLAVIGVALLVWAGTLPSEEEQQRQQQALEQEQQRQQQRRQLATGLNARLERIGTDLNRRRHGQEVPGLIEGNEVPALTDVFEDLETNRATLGEDLYGLLRQKAQLALSLARVQTQERLREIAEQWVSVNQEVTERLR
jgi:type II secretory pathway component PulJ